MLPKQLKYGSKVESAPSKSFKSNVAPQNGTGNYGLNDNIIINIPTRANLCLVPSESYLKFNVAFTSTDANNNIRWDSCGAHSIIQRLRIFHGSNLLQDIDNYGLLAKVLFDLQVPTDACYGKYSVLAGTRPDLMTNQAVPTYLIGDEPCGTAAQILSTINKVGQLVNNGRSTLQVNSGDIVSSTNTAGGAATAKTYCINLISLLGTLCPQYIPLFACTSAPIRLELQLIDSAIKGVATVGAITAMTVSNVEYVATMIELSDQAMGLIQSSLNGQPLQFVVPDYRNYAFSNATLTQNTSVQVQMPIAAKFSSLKSILITVRDKGTGTLTFFPFSSVKLGIQDYTFRVGSQVMPPKAPNTIPEMFSEVLKAVGSMSNLDHHPSIESFSYSLDASVAHTAAGSQSSGSFYIGLDFENYANASKDSIFAGYNSNTDDIYAVINFLNTNASVQPRLDAFCMFDAVYVFDSNTIYERF
jgi:hypothetical protein